MKRLIFILVFVIVNLFIFTSCNLQTGKNLSENDSIIFVTFPSEYYQKWFTNFENQNPNWLDQDNGIQQLNASFDSMMINDLNFAKCVITDASSYGSSKYNSSVLTYESLGGGKDTITNEKWEMVVFLMSLEVELKEPLYNGDETITLYYEVINPIPNTEKYHFIPYTNEVDTCIKLKDIYFNDRVISEKIIGSYIVGKKCNNTK